MDCETTESYAFKNALAQCRMVEEKTTSYVEIFRYSVWALSTRVIRQHTEGDFCRILASTQMNIILYIPANLTISCTER